MTKKDIRTLFPSTTPPENTLIQRTAQQDGFLYIEIFGGNSPENIVKSRKTKEKISQQETRRSIFHLAEMDICWAENEQGKTILYSYHPSRKKYLHPLSFEKVIEKQNRRECHFVQDLLALGRDINFFFDLKTGIGSSQKALKTLLDLVAEKADDCLFYSYDPLLLAQLSSLNPSLAMSVRTMKQWTNGKSILVPRVSAAGSLVNVYDLPVGAITINAALHRVAYLRQLNDHVRERGKHLIFGTLGKNKEKFLLAYDLALGANMNKLSFEDVKELL